MNAIVFGINGQDGYYLRSILKDAGFTVIGVSRSGGNNIIGDVSDKEFVKNLIITHQPQYIFHLAANSTISHDVVFENHQTISDGTIYILEYVKQFSKHTKIFLSGSALQFVNNGNLIKETDPFIGNNIYSVERIYSVYAGRYFRNLGIKVYVGYFFHHDSPFRSDRHLSMKIIKTGIRIKNGSKEFLEIGNPDIVKEFNHAHDLMQAAWCLVTQDEVFEAVLGSGVGYRIRDWIDICFEKIGIDKNHHVRLIQSYNNDFLAMVSNPETIRSLGWKPVRDIYHLANDMINNG